MDEEYIRIKNAAVLLGVTPLTLRNWDKKGHLLAYRHPVNNYRLYRVADIQELLSRLQKPGQILRSEPVTMTREAAPKTEPTPPLDDISPPMPNIQKLAVTFEDEV